MGPRLAGVRTGLGDVWPAANGVVDRLAQLQVAPEQWSSHVHRQVAGAVDRLRPEAGPVDPEPVGDLLEVRRRKRALVELIREDLVVGGLLVQVPPKIEAGQVPRPLPTGAAPPVRVPPERRQDIGIVPDQRVRAGRRNVGDAADIHDLAVERETGRGRLEERHRDLREEGAVGPRQVDDQLVASDPDARDVGPIALVDFLGADDVGPLRIGDELRAWRGEVVVRDTVDCVREVPRGDQSAVTETEALADEERVALAAVRDFEARRDLRLQEAPAGPRLSG